MTTFFMHESRHPSYQSFLDHIKFERRFSVHTVRAYADDLTTFFQFIRSQFDVEAPQDISAAMIRSWMASLTLQKVQPRSINRKISSLKSFVKFCLVHGIMQNNPTKAIQVLKTKKRLPSYVEEEQIEKLLKRTAFPDSFDGRT